MKQEWITKEDEKLMFPDKPFTIGADGKLIFSEEQSVPEMKPGDWIHIDTTMPPEMESVLATDGEKVKIAYWLNGVDDNYNDSFRWYYGDWSFEGVKWWMPLPSIEELK